MPSSSSSRRRHHSRGRYYDHGDESFHNPIDAILYMLTGACSSMYHFISTTRTTNPKWDSDDDDDEGEIDGDTLVTETTSHSSSDRASKRRPKRRGVPRSRSHSIRAGMRKSSPPPVSFGVKNRSRSLSKSHFGREESMISTTRQVLRENTEIHLKHQDQEDEISAISAGTLEHMEKMYILQQANKSLVENKQQQYQQIQQKEDQQQQWQHPQETLFDNDGRKNNQVGMVGSTRGQFTNDTTHVFNKENLGFNGPYATSPDRSCTSHKSQVSSHAILSMASSTGTSEFESIWSRPIQQRRQQHHHQRQQEHSMKSHQIRGKGREEGEGTLTESSLYRHDHNHGDRIRRDVDDIPIGVAGNIELPSHDRKKNNQKKSSSSRRGSKNAVFYETPSTRKMKRRIQMDWIGTIDEGIYTDEEEI